MCGRYTISAKSTEVLAAFHAEPAAGYVPPARYNVAPTDPVPVIRAERDQRVLLPMRWGLIPPWAKDASIGARLINARAETVGEKPAFRDSLEKRRCLVVSDGFYEWTGRGKHKQPWLIRFDDSHVFAFAGLWARWRGPAGTSETCTILTAPPNSVAARIHDRMPLIFDPRLDEERIAAWLDTAQAVDVAALSVPRELPGLVAVPVDKRVGNVKNDDASLLTPQSLPLTLPLTPSLAPARSAAGEGP